MVDIFYNEIKIGMLCTLIKWVVILDDGTEIGFSEKPIKEENVDYKHTRDYDKWSIKSGTIIMLEKGWSKNFFEGKLTTNYPLDASIFWGSENYGE